MRAKQLCTRPWVLHSAIALLVFGLVEAWLTTTWEVAEFAARLGVAALGGLVAAVLLPMSTSVGMLAGSLLFGLRVRHVELGALRRLGGWRIGNTTITLRSLPVVIGSEIGPWRRPVILRCWLAGLTSALSGLLVVAIAWGNSAWSTAGFAPSGAFSRGFALVATVLLLRKLWPSRVAQGTSTGWLLFGLPRMAPVERAEFCAGPLAAHAHELLRDGDVTAAAHWVDRLTEEHPELNTTMSCRITMLEAQGEFAMATATLMQHIAHADLPPREMSYNLAGLAGLGFSAVDAGQLPAEDVLPLAKKALHDAIALGYSEFQLSGTKGLLALIENDLDEAVRLATTGAEYNTSPLSRADDYATLARAHMARKDNAAARAALAEAEKLAPWWPRVRATQERLSVR